MRRALPTSLRGLGELSGSAMLLLLLKMTSDGGRGGDGVQRGWKGSRMGCGKADRVESGNVRASRSEERDVGVFEEGSVGSGRAGCDCRTIEVVSRESRVGILHPSTHLAIALRGTGRSALRPARQLETSREMRSAVGGQRDELQGRV